MLQVVQMVFIRMTKMQEQIYNQICHSKSIIRLLKQSAGEVKQTPKVHRRKIDTCRQHTLAL